MRWALAAVGWPHDGRSGRPWPVKCHCLLFNACVNLVECKVVMFGVDRGDEAGGRAQAYHPSNCKEFFTNMEYLVSFRSCQREKKLFSSSQNWLTFLVKGLKLTWLGYRLSW